MGVEGHWCKTSLQQPLKSTAEFESQRTIISNKLLIKLLDHVLNIFANGKQKSSFKRLVRSKNLASSALLACGNNSVLFWEVMYHYHQNWK